MRLPLHIDLRGKKVLVAGMGKVGKRRAEKLQKAGASVTAVDRKKTEMKENVRFIQRNLKQGEIPSLEDYFLVVVATDDEKLNAAIARKAKEGGCLVNRADISRCGDVIFPAVVETSFGVFSFSTLGKNPRLSKKVKEELKRELPKS